MANLSTTSSNNKSYVSNDGKGNTFGRGLMSYIQNRLPYTSISYSNDTLNPKYKYFAKTGLRRSEALAKNSISSSNAFNNMPIGGMDKDTTFGDVMYANIPQDKGPRIRDYRIMASYSDVSDALDEICDEAINPDDNGRIINLVLRDLDLSVREKEQLEDEHNKYMDLFELSSRGWQYFRQFLIEGELFFEQIIHEQYLDKGVLGVINLPVEVIDPVYNNIQNMNVKGFVYRKPIFNPNSPGKIEKIELIPLEENQVVYINSGVFGESKTYTIPFLENARRPYRQLSLIEDAIVIYRLVRAPEKLVFNVDVGNMAPPKAEGYLRRLMQNYWSRKTFDLDQTDVVKKYNPQSMLDSFWFAKRQGSEGTTVTQLQGGQNLGELADLMYFVKKLYRSLKVPISRLDPEDGVRSGTDILREELKFANFIIRMQQRFANGLKKGFITHLKLIGLWDKFELSPSNLDIIFNVPANFYEVREHQRLEMKSGNYSALAASEFISSTFAQKKYLGWKDRDILANREFLRKDAEFQWELSQITEAGPDWKESVALGGLEGATGGSDVGDDMPPDFGGGPAATGEVEDTGDDIDTDQSTDDIDDQPV
jgi:hypothetical protein